jgi:BASS family bile acid:Na+ symporter
VVIFLVILLGAVFAYAVPNAVLWMGPGLQPSFAVTMLLVGTLVRREQLGTLRSRPGRPFAGLAAQYTIMPLLGFAVSLLYDDPTVRTGIVLVGCMPGAMASNVMTLLLGGDLVLSVTMTTLATLATPLLLLVWLPLLTDATMHVDIVALAYNATWMVVLPVSVGIVVRQLKPSLPKWWDRSATLAASIAIVIIILVVVAKNERYLTTLGPGLALGMLGLNLGGYALAYLAATALRFDVAARRTLVIEVGMQNAGLGSVLALNHLGAAGAVPSAFYTALCVVTAAGAAPGLGWAARSQKRGD